MYAVNSTLTDERATWNLISSDYFQNWAEKNGISIV